MDTGIQWIQGYILGYRIQGYGGYRDTRIHGYCDTEIWWIAKGILGYRNMGILEYK